MVVASTVAGALAGTAIGFCLGKFAPGYYRSVFWAGQLQDFDPVAVGIGQGLTQGLAFGAIVGIALVAVLCWYHTRLEKLNET